MKPFVTTHKALEGWKATVLAHNPSMTIFTPEQIDSEYYDDEEGAIKEAKQMALDLELEYKPRG